MGKKRGGGKDSSLSYFCNWTFSRSVRYSSCEAYFSFGWGGGRGGGGGKRAGYVLKKGVVVGVLCAGLWGSSSRALAKTSKEKKSRKVRTN